MVDVEKADEMDKQVLSRAVPQQITNFYVKKIDGLEAELQELFKQVRRSASTYRVVAHKKKVFIVGRKNSRRG